MRLLAAVLVCLLAPPIAAQSEDAARRTAWVGALDRSVNVARWWRYQPHDSAQYRARHLSPEVLRAIRARGVSALRLLVHPDALLVDGSPTVVHHGRVADLRADVSRLTESGFRVVVALHLEPAERLESQIWRDGYGRLWAALSAHLGSLPVSAVAYELASEPVFQGRESTWGAWQALLFAQVRAREPRRLIVLNPARWSSLWALESLPPITDPLVVVGVHYYDPALVTHQGADWGAPRLEQDLTGVPFPPTPVGCAGASAGSATASAALSQYCQSDPVREMRGHFDRIARWRERTGVPVWLSEFGVIGHAPSSTRHAWLSAVVAAATDHHVPWSLFALDEGFGLGRPASPDWALWAILTAR